MTVTGQWADLINPAFTRIFDDVFARFPEEYSTVFDVLTSTQNYEKFSSATGFGMAVDVDEAEEIPADDPAQGLTKILCQALKKFLLINWENYLIVTHSKQYSL